MRTEKENQLESKKAKILSEMTPEERQDEEDFQELLIRAERLKDAKSSPAPKAKVLPIPTSKLYS